MAHPAHSCLIDWTFKFIYLLCYLHLTKHLEGTWWEIDQEFKYLFCTVTLKTKSGKLHLSSQFLGCVEHKPTYNPIDVGPPCPLSHHGTQSLNGS